MSDIAVTARELSRRFGAFTAVDAVSFEVERGEVFGFLGPNGAGKSTTIRMLCGLLAPSSGDAWVDGRHVNTDPDAVKAHIGYMSQRFSLYEDLSVDQNITFYAGIYGVTGSRLARRRKWILEMAGLSGQEHRITGDLSMGWKQRLALGVAVVHEPRILFLDEPTSGVDPVSRRSFWELIHEVAASGVTVFVTTHFMDEAEHCDRLALIYRGRLIALGSPVELKRDLAGAQLWRLRVDRLMEALTTLQGAPGIHDATLHGVGIHVVTDRAMDADALRHLLIRRQLGVMELEPAEPTLEDVFVTLIEREDHRLTAEASA